MTEPNWQARIEGALAAHFKQPDGTSRPGTDYAVDLKRGEATHRIIVRAYLADGITPATRRNSNYHMQTVIDYVFDRLAAGWTPEAGPLPDLTILDPQPGQALPAPPKRGFFKRLVRG